MSPARSALAALALLTACAAGETDAGGSGASFGGPGGSNASPPMAAMTDGMSETGGEGDGTSRPPLMSTGLASDTDALPDTSTTAVDPDTAPPDGTTTDPIELCGNNEIDAPEECDKFNLNDQTCLTLGFTGGLLTCAADCLFDKSKCTNVSCGNGTVEMGEECDCGNQGVTCTGPQLGNATCGSLQSPKGTPYAGGTLACNSPNSCSFNKSACTYCGDGVRNGGESCDGADLGGQTCNGLGFSGGTLSCNGDCSYNTAACQSIVCGNGQCQQGEDSCNCAQDCPDDPGTCSPCQCGGLGGACYCDLDCLNFGDCCSNGPC